MKRMGIVSVVAGLVAGVVVGVPTPAAAAAEIELFAHGTVPAGEAEQSYMVLDAKKPTGSDSKSMQLLNYGIGPNVNCAGNDLFPVWTGTVKGAIAGDMTFKFSGNFIPGPAQVRVWPDITALACNADYPTPAATMAVTLPSGSGTVEAKATGVPSFTATNSIMIQVNPLISGQALVEPGSRTGGGRISYDSTTALTSFKFQCTCTAG